VTIDRKNAALWGIDREVNVRKRSGCDDASPHATAPPQS
jgi:hypothetical protein